MLGEELTRQKTLCMSNGAGADLRVWRSKHGIGGGSFDSTFRLQLKTSDELSPQGSSKLTSSGASNSSEAQHEITLASWSPIGAEKLVDLLISWIMIAVFITAFVPRVMLMFCSKQSFNPNRMMSRIAAKIRYHNDFG
jgi:hypothetical protein